MLVLERRGHLIRQVCSVFTCSEPSLVFLVSRSTENTFSTKLQPKMPCTLVECVHDAIDTQNGNQMATAVIYERLWRHCITSTGPAEAKKHWLGNLINIHWMLYLPTCSVWISLFGDVVMESKWIIQSYAEILVGRLLDLPDRFRRPCSIELAGVAYSQVSTRSWPPTVCKGEYLWAKFPEKLCLKIAGSYMSVRRKFERVLRTRSSPAMKLSSPV